MADMFRRLGLVAGAAALLAATGGCSRIRDHQGYLADQSLIDSVQAGIDNRESVQKTLGRPTFVGQFDESEWFYITRETRQFAFGTPKPAFQQVLAIRFDKAGNVAAVERTGLEKIATVSPSGDKTPTLGRDRGILSELFGNIGQVGSTAGNQGGGTADNPN